MVRVALLCLALAACASHEVRYVPTQCPDIPRPVLPIVPEEAMSCLSDDTYFDIKQRDQLLRQYAEKYETYCETLEGLDEN